MKTTTDNLSSSYYSACLNKQMIPSISLMFAFPSPLRLQVLMESFSLLPQMALSDGPDIDLQPNPMPWHISTKFLYSRRVDAYIFGIWCKAQDTLSQSLCPRRLRFFAWSTHEGILHTVVMQKISVIASLLHVYLQFIIGWSALLFRREAQSPDRMQHGEVGFLDGIFCLEKLIVFGY